MDDCERILASIKSIEDVRTGRLPGYFFPKLIDLRHLIIRPFNEDGLQNICYNLHLGSHFRIQWRKNIPIDPLSKISIEEVFHEEIELESYTLGPKESIIGQTKEFLGISNCLLAKLENMTQLGRIFVNHASHGFIHPGHGISRPFQLMVELTNLGASPVRLSAGMPVFRMYVEKLAYPAVDFKRASSVPRLQMNAGDRS